MAARPGVSLNGEARARFQWERKRSGLTGVELGDLVGVSGATISSIEGGQKNPTTATLDRLCLALDLEWDQPPIRLKLRAK